MRDRPDIGDSIVWEPPDGLPPRRGLSLRALGRPGRLPSDRQEPSTEGDRVS